MFSNIEVDIFHYTTKFWFSKHMSFLWVHWGPFGFYQWGEFLD